MTEKEILKSLESTVFNAVRHVADLDKIETYVIGGFVRDMFLGIPSKDVDIVVRGSGIEMAQKSGY